MGKKRTERTLSKKLVLEMDALIPSGNLVIRISFDGHNSGTHMGKRG